MPRDKLIWTGTWEKDLAEAVSATVRPGDVCLDVGSYRGFFAAVMAVAGASRVLCFEPLPANVSSLKELSELNPLLPLSVHGIALGATDGDAEFAIMPEATMGKLASSPFQPGARRRGDTVVREARLDTLVASGAVPAPHVIKIDVEGAEADVLRGASRTLATSRPALFIEAHTHELAMTCTAMLEAFDYRVSVLETGGSPGDAPHLEVSHLIAQSAKARSEA
jgi:FkbM family methyltransferase